MTTLEETPSVLLAQTDLLVASYESKYRDRIRVNTDLDRGIVSFQGSKEIPVDRWFKYREGFTIALVNYYISRFKISDGKILDPFAGSGTTLAAGALNGLEAHGIELLPIGHIVIEARLAGHSGSFREFADHIRLSSKTLPWLEFERTALNEIRITQMAYREENKQLVEKYISFLIAQPKELAVFYKIALLSILEDISYTRKDGQYLRWDNRSGKTQGNFNKGVIKDFNFAIQQKLLDIAEDLEGKGTGLFSLAVNTGKKTGKSQVFEGSCLEIMKDMHESQYKMIFTSPPYVNRYDYTRTYALELALLGIGEEELKSLRQSMLSCTVENREKNLLEMNPAWFQTIDFLEKHEVFQAMNLFLEDTIRLGQLNNPGIARMVRNYFIEMACVIYESARLLMSGGIMVMVNDNVRYAGLIIPVDIMLCEVATFLGLRVISIDTLPTTKGNSSQQMGTYGQSRLRKCVYVWEKM